MADAIFTSFHPLIPRDALATWRLPFLQVEEEFSSVSIFFPDVFEVVAYPVLLVAGTVALTLDDDCIVLVSRSKQDQNIHQPRTSFRVLPRASLGVAQSIG